MASSGQLQQRGSSLLRRRGYSSTGDPRTTALRRAQAARKIAASQLGAAAAVSAGGLLLGTPLLLRTRWGRGMVADRIRRHVRPLTYMQETMSLAKDLTRKKAKEAIRYGASKARRFTADSVDGVIRRIFGEKPQHLKEHWVQKSDLEFALNPVRRSGSGYTQKTGYADPDELFVISRGTMRGKDPVVAAKYMIDNDTHRNVKLSLIDRFDNRLRQAFLWPLRFTAQGRKVRASAADRQAIEQQHQEWIRDAYEREGLKPPEFPSSGALAEPRTPVTYITARGKLKAKPAQLNLPDFTEKGLAKLRQGKVVNRHGVDYQFDAKRGVLIQKKGRHRREYAQDALGYNIQVAAVRQTPLQNTPDLSGFTGKALEQLRKGKVVRQRGMDYHLDAESGALVQTKGNYQREFTQGELKNLDIWGMRKGSSGFESAIDYRELEAPLGPTRMIRSDLPRFNKRQLSDLRQGKEIEYRTNADKTRGTRSFYQFDAKRGVLVQTSRDTEAWNRPYVRVFDKDDLKGVDLVSRQKKQSQPIKHESRRAELDRLIKEQASEMEADKAASPWRQSSRPTRW